MLTILDMDKDEDRKRIEDKMLSLYGVNNVKFYINARNIVVNYNTALINIEHIVYEIALMRYHILPRG
jgi:hypothetical protein